MSNPSLKNGYLSIANELVEQFALHNIPGNEMRIIWVLWRKTWGWKEGKRRKDWDFISLTQFEKMTDMNRRNVSRSLKSLVAKRLLLKQNSSYKFNQNYIEWGVAKRLLVSNVVVGRGKRGSQGVAKRLHTKETLTKETLTKGKKLNGSKTTMGNKPLEDVMDGIVYEDDEDTKPTRQKRQPKQGKLKARIANLFLERKGERGNITRYFYDIGELISLIQNQLTDDKCEVNDENILKATLWFFDQAEIKYPGKWGFNAIIKHFNELRNS